jgi:RHS repeat-associated protein
MVFHYDLDGKLIAESLPDGTLTAEYLYMGKIRIAKVDVNRGRTYYYLNDRLGTPQIMTDDNGNIVWEASYKPFGEATVNPKSTVENNFRFPGQYYDKETGMHYNYHRYYDPKIGRYLTPDPFGLMGGMNLFAYAANNPIGNIDEYGLFCLPICIPYKWNKEQKVVFSQKETWLTGADVLCYYQTRQQDILQNFVLIRFMCIIFEREECSGNCAFDRFEQKVLRLYSGTKKSGWRVVKTFWDFPVGRRMGHIGIRIDCPPKGPNWKGEVKTLPLDFTGVL